MADLFSTESEKSVLGGMLLDASIAEKAVMKLSADDFYGDLHKKIFTAMEMLAVSKEPIDLVTVTDYLEKHEGNAKFFKYLSDMTMFCVSTANVDSHISKIKGYAMRRKWLQKAEEIKTLANDTDKPVQEAYCDIISAIESTKPDADKSEDEHIKAILMEVYQAIGEKASGKGLGIRTGIASYDAITGGLFPGELTVIGARPGCGKSAIAQQMAIGIAKKGIKVQFFSLEMSREQYGVRVFSFGSGVDSTSMRTGKVQGDDFDKFFTTMNDFKALPLFINTKARTPLQMRNVCLNRGDIGMVVVDYLQLVKPNGKYGSREQEVAAVSRAFKELALELNAPVIALSQLNRNADNRPPTMSELRESGAIEQDADCILLLHEPTKWQDPRDQQTMIDCNAREERLIYVHMAKQRQGSTGYFNLVFRPKHMEFLSLMKE